MQKSDRIGQNYQPEIETKQGEEKMERKLNRREFLRLMSAGAGVVALASCGVPPATPTSPPPAAATKAPVAPAATATAAGPEPLTLPIVKEPLKLTYWVETNPNVAASMKSFNEMALYQELGKKTGIQIDFQQAPVGQGLEQFNLMIASGKYPDVIEFGFGGKPGEASTAPGGPARYIKDGVIVRLNELINKYAPNLKKVLQDHPDWHRQIVTDEGDLYGFPFLRGDPLLLTTEGPTIRADWLDKLKLQPPTTIDEWHDVLKAFKEKDPNGNGKADELPFSPFWNPRPLNAFYGSASFIGAWGMTLDFYQENGVVKHCSLAPEMKDWLKVMAQWYKEGLIDPDFVSTDQKTMDAKVTSNQLGAFVARAGSGMGKYIPTMVKDNPSVKFIPVSNPTLKPGERPILGAKDFEFNGQVAAISTANKRVVETVKWLDYAFSPEGHMLFNFGVEGVSYKMENGYPKYTDAVLKDPKLAPSQAMPRYFRASFNGPFVQDRRYIEQYYQLPEQIDALKKWSTPVNAKWIPMLTPTQDESKKFATIMNDVNSRTTEAITRIITGAMPVDSWDQVVKEFKQMGIEDAVKIWQAAYDRYSKRSLAI